MEGTYVGLAVLAAAFIVEIYVLASKESKAVTRKESVVDPMFRARRTGSDKRFR
jgi:hypothetical protein